MNDPEQTINTSKAGRRAAMARDGRLDKATADTVQMQPMAAHTPGPWYVDGDGHVTANADDEHGICRPIICERVMGFSGDEAANARLIAAAPEMLEALRKAHSAISDLDHIDNEVARDIYDLIAKATGAKP